MLWDRGYGGKRGDFPGGVVALADGSILIGGETASFGAGDDDAFLLELDATATGTACDSWGGPGLDHGDDVEVAPDGTRVLGATTELAAVHARGLPAADQEAARDCRRAGRPDR